MGVIVALILTNVWELSDSEMPSTKRQVTPFLYIGSLPPVPLESKTSVREQGQSKQINVKPPNVFRKKVEKVSVERVKRRSL